MLLLHSIKKVFAAQLNNKCTDPKKCPHSDMTFLE